MGSYTLQKNLSLTDDMYGGKILSCLLQQGEENKGNKENTLNMNLCLKD